MKKARNHKHCDGGMKCAIGALAVLGMVTVSPVQAAASSVPGATSVLQQQDGVKGRVVDEKGEPLIGVTVRAANGAATVTDLDGNYQLNVAQGTPLTLSYTGYKEAKVKAGAGPHGARRDGP